MALRDARSGLPRGENATSRRHMISLHAAFLQGLCHDSEVAVEGRRETQLKVGWLQEKRKASLCSQGKNWMGCKDGDSLGARRKPEKDKWA